MSKNHITFICCVFYFSQVERYSCSAKVGTFFEKNGTGHENKLGHLTNQIGSQSENKLGLDLAIYWIKLAKCKKLRIH